MPSRDPDDLLEAFAQLTEREPGQFVPSTRGPIVRRLAVAVVALVLVATIGGLAAIYGPRLAPGADDRVELITHHLTDTVNVGTHTGIAGVPVMREGDCLYITIPGDHHWLTVWPAGTTIDERQHPAVIRDANGDRITTVGEIFSLSGASIDASGFDDIRPYLDAEVPAGCTSSELLLIDPGVAALRPEIATWRLNPANPPDPTSSTLHIEIQENACSSRQDPTGRTLPPEITYDADDIVITMSILEIGGRCPGNPYFPMTVELTEPIGDRSLVDGYDRGVRWQPVATLPTPSPSTPDGAFVTEWRIDAAAPIGPDATMLHLLVAQEACRGELESLGHVLDPEITYTSDDIVIKVTAVRGFDPADCDFPGTVTVPTLIQLAEPVGGRSIRDARNPSPGLRWRLPPADAVALPTTRHQPWPIGRPFMDNICAGVGLDAFLTGAPDDPRLVWLVERDGVDISRPLSWPPGFTVRFDDGVLILNEAAQVVRRGGDHVDGACVTGDDGLILYGNGYSVLD